MSVLRQASREPAPGVGDVAPCAPEAAEGRDHAQRVLDSIRGKQPIERGSDVVEFDLEQGEPTGLFHAGSSSSASSELEELLRMPLSENVQCVFRLEAIECVLTHCLEHREPHLAVRHLAPYEAPGNKRLEIPEKLRP